MSTVEPSGFYTPEQAAAKLGVAVRTLVELLRVRRYNFTDLSPDGLSKPWGRGRKVWGLTYAQFDAIVAGQSRRFPEPATPASAAGTPARVGAGQPLMAGHDGIRRLRRSTRRPDPGL